MNVLGSFLSIILETKAGARYSEYWNSILLLLCMTCIENLNNMTDMRDMSPLLDTLQSTVYTLYREHRTLITLIGILSQSSLQKCTNLTLESVRGYCGFLSTFLRKYNIPEDIFEQFVERNILGSNSQYEYSRVVRSSIFQI